MKKIFILITLSLIISSILYCDFNSEDLQFSGSQIINTQTDEPKICCESFGYGIEMEKCCESYEWSTILECSVPEDLDGGGKQIVEDMFCN